MLVVVDSCFAGKLFGGSDKSGSEELVDKEKITALKDYSKYTSRLGLTASADKPIPDAGGGKGMSVFSRAFIEVLEENEKDFFSSDYLSVQMKDKIVSIRDNLPDNLYKIYKNVKSIHSPLKISEHEPGGEFYFDMEEEE